MLNDNSVREHRARSNHGKKRLFTIVIRRDSSRYDTCAKSFKLPDQIWAFLPCDPAEIHAKARGQVLRERNEKMPFAFRIFEGNNRECCSNHFNVIEPILRAAHVEKEQFSCLPKQTREPTEQVN